MLSELLFLGISLSIGYLEGVKYLTTWRFSRFSIGTWPWKLTARCSMQVITASSSLSCGLEGRFMYAVHESRWLLSTGSGISPYSRTVDLSSKGVLGEGQRKSKSNRGDYAALTRNSASTSVKNPSIIIKSGVRERIFTEVKRCSGHFLRY